MSRDYKSRKSNSTPNKTGGSLFLGLFIGYAFGLASAIGIWMYISQAPSPFLETEEMSTVSQSKEHDAGKTLNESATNSTSKKEAIEDNDKFDFYKILPGNEETVIEQAFEPVIQPLPQPTRNEPIVRQQQTPLLENNQSQNYFLQAGSFRSTGEAENLKARLALLGVVAAVRSANLGEKGTWHRVRIGPFVKMTEVEQVRNELQQNGIQTQFIKTD